MRVIWRDSSVPKEYKPLKYRGYMIHGTPKGWTTDFPGDDNIYFNHFCAQNAIDAALGGTGIRGRGHDKRLAYGITIIGKTDSGSRA